MNIAKEKEEKIKIIVCKITILALVVYFAGVFANTTVRAINGWKMPVFSQLEIPADDETHCNATASTKLIILCDWITISKDSLLTLVMRKINGIDTYDDILASPGDLLIWISSWILILISPITIIFIFLNKLLESR